MRTAERVSAPAEDDQALADRETIFNGLLLAVIGRRRLLVVAGDGQAARVALLARLAAHVEADGCMVMTVTAAPGATVEDLVEVAGAGLLGRDYAGAPFERIVEALEARLDQAGTGFLIVEEAEKLAPDTLRDLVDLSGSITPAGRFLQVMLSGAAPLRDRIIQADLMPIIETVGTLYHLGPVTPARVPDRPAPAPQATGITGLRSPEPGSAGWRTAPMAGAPKRHRRGGMGRLLLLFLVLAGAGAGWAYQQGILDPADLDPTGLGTRIGANIQALLADRPGQDVPPSPARAAPAPAPAPAAAPEPEGSVDAEGFTREDVARFADLAGRVLREDPRLGPPAGGEPAPAATGTTEPETIQPGSAETVTAEPTLAESQPLSAEELAEIDQPAPAPAAAIPPGPVPAPTAAADDSATDPPGAAEDTATGERIAALVERAEGQMAERRLTTPRNDNALITLGEIRAIDPRHPAVTDLSRRMVATYLRWADVAEARRDWPTAVIYYQRALRVVPGQRDIETRLAAAGRRIDRPATATAAQQAPPTQPAPASPPAQDDPAPVAETTEDPPVPTLRP
ncbi:MAG: hypothetical protein RLY86_2962 [Pseudomonadota bacterium]|jgi:hypothetical protein